MPTARPSLREGPPATPAPLEPIHPLLAPERGSEDQHATRREAEVCGPILDHGHLIGSQGVPSFLKATEYVPLALNAFTWPPLLSKRKKWKWLLEWDWTWIEA